MKPSRRLLLLLACFALAGCQEQLDSLFGRKPASPPPAEPAAPSPGTKPAPKPGTTPPKPSPAPTQAPKPTPAPAPSPSAATASPREKEIEAKYPMPDFKPLESLVDNWNTIPPNVLEAVGTVTVNVPLEYQLYVDGNAIGSSKSQPGHKAKVLQQKAAQLLVTNRPDGSTRAVVGIDETTLKDQVRGLYDQKVTETKERVLKARRVALQALSQGGEAKSFGTVNADPRFAPVRDYLAAGKLESGILEEAKEWLWMGRETHDGQSYDVVLMNFQVNTLFGMFPNSMKCLLRGGQVVKWVDAETGEERR